MMDLLLASLLTLVPAQQSASLLVDFNRHDDGIYTTTMLKKDWLRRRWSSLYNRASIVSGSGGIDGKRLRVFYPAGGYKPKFSGGQFQVKIKPYRDEYYLDYYVKFNAGFDFGKGGKLPGLAGGRRNTGNDRATGDGWSIRYMWNRSRKVSLYIYHMDQRKNHGDNWYLRGRKFKVGRWHRLTQRVKLNTNNEADGILEVWLDGKKLLSRSNVRFRANGQAAISTFYFSTFHGGSKPSWAPKKDSYAEFDLFRLADTYEEIFGRD